MEKTKIEWSTGVWNPVTDRTGASAGCKNRYAERPPLRLRQKFTTIALHPERLDQPLRWRKPRQIFVSPTSDLFHEEVRIEFLDKCFAVMALSHQHVFQVLTEHPERMRSYLLMGSPKWWLSCAKRMEKELNVLHVESRRYHGSFEFPLRNVWLGVSVEDQKTADERIPLLLHTPAAIHFVSYEPARGPVTFNGPAGSGRIDWVVAAGESGLNARPSHPDWFRSVRDQCQAAGVPFFFKGWGEWAPSDGDDSPGELRIINLDGTPSDRFDSHEQIQMEKYGKARAGRLLDGKEHNEFPA